MADRSYPVIIGANGNATLSIRIEAMKPWRVRQVSVKGTTAPAGSLCQLKKNGVFITPIIATGGAATEPPAVDLYAGDTMTVEFTGFTAGTYFSVYIIYDQEPWAY